MINSDWLDDLQEWSRNYKPDKEEIEKEVGYSIPGTFIGCKHSDYSKSLMSAKKKGIKRVPLSEKHKDKLRVKRPHAGKNIAAGKSFDWMVTNVKTGEVFQIKNLNAFCRSNGLAPGNLYKTLTGVCKQHKGYAIRHA